MSNAPVTLLVLGAGGRGTYAYAPYARKHPEALSIIAVAEPDQQRRDTFSALHEIPPERQYAGYADALAGERIADAVLNCTMDQMHLPSTLAALEAGYDVLLEKPMAVSPADCKLLVATAERLGRTLQICHVLRYTRFFSTLYEIVRSGRLGKIITIDHRENVSTWHMSHSFVRGNWRNEASSAPMILAKCCHDLDILVWLTGSTVSKLSSFGSLAHYRSQNAPPGAPLRCTDGCPIEQECIWYAPKLYDAAPAPGPDSGGHNFMKFALSGEQTRQGRWETLKTSRFGRCVYHCDNDVVDRQTINMLFENDITCTFTMHGHSERESRTMRWDGTRATLYGEFGENQFLRIVDHGTLKEEIIHIEADESGHGGGDTGLIRDFIDAMHGKTSSRQTTARVSLESHLLCFAAEESRHSGQTINMANYR